MRKFALEDTERFDRAIKYAKLRQLFMWFIWNFFCVKKAERLESSLKMGMSFEAAYKLAKRRRC